ncbi:MAG: Rieske 2Fe-2S domain-containing protein [Gemmataceae bacterium]|nr:Rieske 2Fe-2S domain-containing protein [Gemmataceae bacterium]
MSADLRAKLRPFDAALPLERAHTIPSTWYLDPEIAAAERRHVFGATWQAVGRVDQLAGPGSYFTANVAGEPVVVVRDTDGVVRAFANVCRHRAAQVMNEPQGQATRLRCRYHGWTYDLCGKLRGTPEFDGVADFRREDHGLPPLAVDIWGPLVFVHLGTNPPPLTHFLAPLPRHESTRDLKALRFVGRREYELACNWKVFVDNYLDGGYHVNTVHPGLAGVIDYSQYRTDVFEQCSVQVSPLKPPDADAAAVGQVRSGASGYYWWLFPNFMLNLYQGVMDTNLVLPLGPQRCRVVFDFYFARTEGAESEKFIARSIAVAEQIQQEDIGICEDVQRGLASRSFDTGRFSVKREAGGYHFHRLLARYLIEGQRGASLGERGA